MWKVLLENGTRGQNGMIVGTTSIDQYLSIRTVTYVFKGSLQSNCSLAFVYDVSTVPRLPSNPFPGMSPLGPYPSS